MSHLGTFPGTLGRGWISVSHLQKDVPWSSVGHVTEALPHVQGLTKHPAHSRHIINLAKGFPVGMSGKELPVSAGDKETQVQSLGQEDPLEEGMATHSSILAWRIPWTEELGRL